MSCCIMAVDKSKKAIKDALFELMSDKEFSQITVNELLARANISRGTFYTHFSNLEDVRKHLINDIFEHADEIFSDYKASEIIKDPYPALLTAAEAMLERFSTARQLIKVINVYDLSSNLITWLTKFILEDEILVMALGGATQAKLYARFIAGGVINSYSMWIAEFTDDDVDSEFLARTISNILVGGLNTALLE